jgi:hypothetical protein
MIESRRSFLQKLLLAAVAAGIDPLRTVTTAGDLYTNTRLGLTVRRPASWDFSSIADFAALRDRQVLMDAADDEIHPLKDPDNLPVFLFEDAHAREGAFAPAIALYDEALHGPAPVDPVAGHRDVMLAGFATSYRNVAVRQLPVAVNLHGTIGTWSHWSYDHDLDDGTSRPLSVRSLVVFREPRVHTFHFVESPTSMRDAQATWEGFLRSISYERIGERPADTGL